jgi:hypothetical protein
MDNFVNNVVYPKIDEYYWAQNRHWRPIAAYTEKTNPAVNSLPECNTIFKYITCKLTYIQRIVQTYCEGSTITLFII